MASAASPSGVEVTLVFNGGQHESSLLGVVCGDRHSGGDVRVPLVRVRTAQLGLRLLGFAIW